MRGDRASEDFGDWLPAKAAVAGLAALCAAALAAGVFDGVPAAERPRGQALAGERHAATAAPVPGLCFHGPRGEPVDFPAERHCPRIAPAQVPQ